MPGRPLINIPPEKTQVSRETEVDIPWIMTWRGAIAGDSAILAIFAWRVIGFIWRDGFRVAGEWIALWWGAWMQSLLVPWFLICAALFFSFFIQTIDKHWPATRKAREADDGLFVGIFGPRRERRRDEDYDRFYGGDEDGE